MGRENKDPLIFRRPWQLGKSNGGAVGIFRVDTEDEHGARRPEIEERQEQAEEGCAAYEFCAQGLCDPRNALVSAKVLRELRVAERVGFEPTNRFYPVTRFPVVLLRPTRTSLRAACYLLRETT